MSQSLSERVRETNTLSSPSPLALEVLRLARDEKSRVDDLIALIESDAVLSARILATVNSSFYGMSRRILSLRQAIVALGLRSLRVMALSFSLVDTVRGAQRDGDCFDYARHWRRSLSTAVAGRILARASAPTLAEDAFTCGLVSDIGIAAAWCSAADLYAPVLEQARQSGAPLHQAEQAAFGISHAGLGAELLRCWGLPEPIPAVVAAHHGENEDALSGEARDVAVIVQLAARLGAIVNQDESPDAWGALRLDIAHQLAITDAALDEMLAALGQQVRETAALLNVAASEGLDPASLRSDAAARLAELAVRSEIERTEATRQAQAARDRLSSVQEVNKRFLKAAMTDALTALANRGAFDKQARAAWKRSQVQETPLAVLVVDIDHFKRINDRYGHGGGDHVLQVVGERIRQALDVTGFVARYGGDEFGIICPDAARDRLAEWGERVRAGVCATPVEYLDTAITVTVSVGGARVERAEGEDPNPLIAAADAALYRAKERGRNCFVAADACPTGTESWLTRLRRMVGKS